MSKDNKMRKWRVCSTHSQTNDVDVEYHTCTINQIKNILNKKANEDKRNNKENFVSYNVDIRNDSFIFCSVIFNAYEINYLANS